MKSSEQDEDWAATTHPKQRKQAKPQKKITAFAAKPAKVPIKDYDATSDKPSVFSASSQKGKSSARTDTLGGPAGDMVDDNDQLTQDIEQASSDEEFEMDDDAQPLHEGTNQEEETSEPEKESEVDDSSDNDNEAFFDVGAEIKRQQQKQARIEKKGNATNTIDNLPKDPNEMWSMVKKTREANRKLLQEFFAEAEEADAQLAAQQKIVDSESCELRKLRDETVESREKRHLFCIPMSTNIKKPGLWSRLVDSQLKHGGRLFDVITMDPPWVLSTGNPTRGVATNYSTLNDNDIMNIPFDQLQRDGFLFIWVINNKYKFALQLFDKYGYRLIDELVWVKQTVNGKIAKGHGYYLQHAKETCLIGYKGDLGSRLKGQVDCDVIFS